MESKLQKKVIRDLRKKGWYVVKLVIAMPPGNPDTWCGKDGKCIWIEFKDEGEEPEPLQLHRHAELRSQGFDVFVIDTYEQYLHIRHKLGGV